MDEAGRSVERAKKGVFTVPVARMSAERQRLAGDQWGCDDRHVRHLFDPVVNWLLETVPGFKKRYPTIWKPTRSVSRVVREMLLSEELLKEYLELFRGKTEAQLDELARSFLLGKLCRDDQRATAHPR